MADTKIVLLTDSAVIPTRATPNDTGYDITFTGVNKIIGDTIFFKTGISVKPPVGHYFEIFPRSSISKMSLSLANSIGVIDEDYTGEILVPIRVHHPDSGLTSKNFRQPSGIIELLGHKPKTIHDVGELILLKKPVLVQMVLRKRLDTNFSKATSLEETQRSSGGFGSSDSSRKSVKTSPKK